MKKLNDPNENNLIINQNSKLEKDFKLTTSSEIITKNNYLKNLYFIGFNSKPVNKAIINSINISEAVCSIKSFLKVEDSTIKLCGSLVLGLCKIYEKKIKLYYEELENMLRMSKDKKTLKAEKMQEDKLKGNGPAGDYVNLTAENENTKLKKSKKKFNNLNNNKNSTLDNIRNNILNAESNYYDLSTNLNLNTNNSNSIRDFSLENNKTKKIFNLYDISELNSEMPGSLTKRNLNNLERNQIQTPSKMRNIFDNSSKNSLSEMDFLRAKNSNLPSAYNMESNSRFLNSGNKMVNGLIDRSNMEDEIFNKNLNNFFLKIVSDEKLNFDNIDNLFQPDDYAGNFANEDNNNDNFNNNKLDDLVNKNSFKLKKLVFPELKYKLELEVEKSENFESTFDAGMLKSIQKPKNRGKNKKANFEVDREIYLKLELPLKAKEDRKSKRIKSEAEQNWIKVDYDLPEYLELKEKVGKFL